MDETLSDRVNNMIIGFDKILVKHDYLERRVEDLEIAAGISNANPVETDLPDAKDVIVCEMKHPGKCGNIVCFNNTTFCSGFKALLGFNACPYKKLMQLIEKPLKSEN